MPTPNRTQSQNGVMTTQTSEILSTSEVAERAGVNVQTVRYYERRGLLPEPPRSKRGHRQYGTEHVDRIRFVKRAQDLGFTLDEAEELLQLRVTPDADRADVRARAEAKIEEVRDRIRDLQRIETTLEELVEKCEGHGSTSACPILHAIEPSTEESNAQNRHE